MDLLPGILRGRYLEPDARDRDAAPLRRAATASQHPSLIAGFEPNAPRMRAELVKASHFIVDTRPDLVLDRARELFELG